MPLSHRHAQVRVNAIAAAKALVLSELDAWEELAKYFWALSRDKSPVVRGSLYDCLCELALDLVDRYFIYG